MRRALLAAGVAILCLVVAVVPAGGAGNSAANWVQSVPQAKFANLLLIGSLTNAASGFNFDGYAKGKLEVTVPAGWTVHVVFLNAGSVQHSVMVVPWSTKPTAKHPTPAFPGATTSLPYKGLPKGSVGGFTFVARKPGKYRLLCAVPGHDAIGMWDTLVVKRGAKGAGATVSG